ncbi:hypothetical protein E2C01_029823 [Portunus trituberculatus]|uniref:CCHC-type domain-containing protein n=1 Tax=Portunus trituberculatus TaxID=210409 RepID=A0A5B7ET07_PORTR|nr:hypothetical protein [Portunus trituberculatus]
MPHHSLAAQKPQRRHLPARRTQVQQGSRRTSSGEFSGLCWKCGQRGHRRSDCRGERRTRSLEDVDATALAVRGSGAVDGRPCPLVVNTGAAKTFVRKEVVAAQDVPVSNRQLCGVTGHWATLRSPVMSTITVGGVEEKLPVFVADMEEPCLLGLDLLVQIAACVNLGRMQMQVRGETVSLILEDAAKQVESTVMRTRGWSCTAESRPPRIVHVAPLWTAVEEEHFTWDQQGPLSSPDSEVGSNSEMEGDGGIDNVAECVVGARKDPENESENEACVSRPLRKRKKPQWWTDYVCESDDE